MQSKLVFRACPLVFIFAFAAAGCASRENTSNQESTAQSSAALCTPGSYVRRGRGSPDVRRQRDGHLSVRRTKR
jgi:hypothetical protein